MKEPGFVTSLREELRAVVPEIQERVHRSGALTDERLLQLVQSTECYPAAEDAEHPAQEDVVSARDEVTLNDEYVGEQAIGAGKVAFLVMAGGAGTRMGGPKLFAKLPSVGLTLLGWKLLQAGTMPVWVMTTPDVTAQVDRHISTLTLPQGMNGTVFEQFEGYRLTPDNRLSLIAPGTPELHPLGHGDVGPALVEAGVFADNPSVEHVVVCNVDNVMASPHAGLIGHHIRTKKAVTCEVVERGKGEAGGVVARLDGRLQVVEGFRLTPEFIECAQWQNTNTLIIDVSALKQDIGWRWHRVRKDVSGRIVVQHERLLQQYTETYDTSFVVVPRADRYVPVKTADDLKRADEAVNSHRVTL